MTTATDPSAPAYDVRGLLGRGGMGVVELATDPSGALVAVKRVALTGSALDIARARSRIRREAEVLAALHHPAIVPLLDVHDDGTDLVMVMPYLPGGNLAQRVTRHGPMPAAEVAALVPILLDALAAAHQAGIVHRDITPANILFDGRGQPVVADFGMASSPRHTLGLTAQGVALGTAGFMPPEQARGERAGPASDVFGVGACLFFALTGQSPYGSGSPEVLGWRAARGEVRSLPASIRGALRTAVMAMLRANPRDRPDPAVDLLARVSAARARRRAAAWTAAVAAVSAVLIAGSLLVASGPRPHVGGAAAAAPAAPPCTPLPFQPCGQAAPAPFTDGRVCIDGHADYDGDPVNGCEASPDGLNGSVLQRDQVLVANLVPADEVDTYRTFVTDRPQLLCDGRLTLRLTAPPGVADRVEILQNGAVLASAVSRDGSTAAASVDEPSCFHDDSGWLLVRVTPVSGRTAAAYRLEETGSF